MMAKKKSKAKAQAEPKKAPKKKETSSSSWIVGVIIVIAVIVLLILLMKGCEKEPEVTPAPAVDEKPKEVKEEPGLQEVLKAPELELKCPEEYTIGWPKREVVEPCKVQGNVASVKLMYSGRGDSLSGIWFEVTATDGEVKYFKDSKPVEQDEIREYTLDLGKKIDTILAMPMIVEGGVEKACKNQRLLIIKATSCIGQ